ncbi:NAD(P)H-binding protein [Amorphoplanes nipponensis]|uniref:Nucleoside-diphosphate-sugar epimerase n=1 Tax=Actinoplanes nipponensis TaxID=135950 RepID=A0A919MF89_9ACTN|nr:hypothetical protein Ani05nite_08030 [Actinoplanes nipponensis]
MGRLLTARLAADGHRVRVLTRTRPARLPAGVEHTTVDLREPAAAAAAAGGGVLYHVAGAPYAAWNESLPRIATTALAAAAATGAPLIYLDNLYAVGAPTGPITEDTPAAPVGAKGRLRHRLAAQLVEAARSARVSGVSVVHASDFFGPGVTAAVPHALVLDPVSAGRAPRWPISLDQPHALSYTPDVAHTLAALGVRESSAQAGAQRWLVPADGAPTGREFIAAVARNRGGELRRPGTLSVTLLRLAGLFNADARALGQLSHQYARPWTVDSTRTSRELGVTATPLAAAVAATVARSVAPGKPGNRS